MKKLIPIILIFAFTFSAYSQNKKTIELLSSIEGKWQVNKDKYPYYQKVVEVPDIDTSTLFQRVNSYANINLNGEIVSNYPDQFILSKRHLVKRIHSGFMEYSDLLINVKFECKDEKVRITLTCEKIQQYVSDNKKPDIRKFSRLYPINQEALLDKNKQARWFYNSHIKSLEIIELIASYLDGPEKLDENW